MPVKMPLIILASLGIATSGMLVGELPSVSSQPQPWGMGGDRPGMMQQMHAANSEFEFFSLMIPHHQEAIDRAELVLEESDRREMREFARQIIEVQSAEIEQMETWLDRWYPNQESDLVYRPMMRDLSQYSGAERDRVFLEDMIRHHMGAVMMSRRLVNHGLVEHESVRPFAQNIATTQRQEIWQMRDWLQEWYGNAGMPDCGGCHRDRRTPMPHHGGFRGN